MSTSNAIQRSEQFNRDLAYFTPKFASQQEVNDLFDAEMGFPRTDLAYAEAMKREVARTLKSTWEESKESFKASLELRRFEIAIGA